MSDRGGPEHFLAHGIHVLGELGHALAHLIAAGVTGVRVYESYQRG